MKNLMYRLRCNAATHTALTIVAFLGLTLPGFADVPATPVSISAEPGAGIDAGPLITLRWDALSNAVYKVQRRAGLEADKPWETFDLVSPTGPVGLFKLTPDKAEANGDSIRRSFFRLALPQTEIFSVEPALFAPGTPVELYVLGQCFASNDIVKVDGVAVPGGSVLFQDQSRLRVSLPAQSAGAHRIEVARAGAVLSAFDLTCADAVSAPEVALAEPPGEWPPGTPALMKAKEKANRTKCSSNLRQIAVAAGGGGINEEIPEDWAQIAPAAMKAKEKANRSKRVSVRQNSSDVAGEMCQVWGHHTAKNSIGNIRARTAGIGGDDDEDCDSDADDSTMNNWPGTFEVMPFSAELRHQVVDLFIPGRGIDFVFARTYRSRTGADTSMGHGWTHSYDIRVEQVGADLALYDGTGRRVGLKVTTNGTWAADGFFYEVAFVNGRIKVKFPWLAEWEFNPFDGSASAGKISASRDTYGNSITCLYGSLGRLTQIVDTLGHTNTLGYTSDGYLASITDYTGRAVTYQYYAGGTAGGIIGDLRSATMPPVTGTPNGNDFPDGKTTRYAYSIRFADDRLNHNLTSVTDPKNQNWLQIYYRTNLDAASFNFDAVDYLQRGAYRTHVRRFPLLPAPANQFATVQAIMKDGVGNVSECFYDSQNRCVRQLDYTGRANPDQPTTQSQNRPAGKVRASDPDFFETRWTWNVDSLCTRMTLPRGNEIECIYERDFNRNANARKKGDLRVQREVRVRGLADPNLTDEYLTARFEYDSRFGSPTIECRMRTRINELEAHLQGIGLMGFASGPRQTVSLDMPFSRPGENSRIKLSSSQPEIVDNKKGPLINFVVSATDPRGNRTRASYDANGSCVRVTAPLATSLPNVAVVVDCAYNTYGQLVSITNAPDGTGRRSVDTFEYYTDPAASGYGHLQACTRDNFLQGAADVIQALRTAYEYDSLGRITRCIDPRTNDWLFTYNALGQLMQKSSATCCTGGHGGGGSGGARYATQFTYDANDNLIRSEHENRDHTGALGTNPFWRTDFVYDSLNRMTGCWRDKNGNLVLRCQEVQFDANDNITLYRSPEAVNGNDPNAVVQFQYDERGLIFCVIQAPGTALAENKDVELNFNGRVVAVSRTASGGAKLTCALYEYDGFDRLVHATDAMGNVDTYAYDANHNLVYHRFDGELNDVPGSANNLRYHEWRWSYDGLDRPTIARASFFNISTQVPIGDGEATTTCAYAPNGLLLSVTDDNGHTTRYTYDGAHRLSRVTDAKSNRVDYVYDKNGNVTTVTETERSDLGGADQVFVTGYSYDKLNRCESSSNNVGNAEQYFYDSRGNLVRQIDANGNLTGWVYDGLSRCTVSIADLDGDGLLDFAADVGTAQAWDDNDRLISRTDDNVNTTTYAYDSLNRCVTTHNPDDTGESLVWSPRSNLSSRTDANGTVTHYTYDLNDRLVRKDILPGRGVASTTTFEQFTYDGMSRIVRATNDVSMLDFSYDSLGSLEKAKQDCLATARISDSVGNCLSMTYPGGRVVLSAYDELNRLATINTLECSGCISVRAATYSYDGPGRLARIIRANGVNTRINWNGLVNPANQTGDFGSRQVLRVNHARAGGTLVIDQRLFAYDRMQNKTLRAQTAPWVTGGPLSTNAFAYNKLHRLTRGRKSTAAGIQQDTTYQLDGNGNRQQVMVNGAVQNYVMNSTTPDPADFQMDQYTFTPFGSQQYDRNGNLLSSSPPAPGPAPTYFTYDYGNRLVQVSRLGSGGTLEPVVSFTYDALGRRISETTYPGVPAAPLVTQFIHGTDLDSGAVIEERQNGKVTMSYVRPRCQAGSRHSEEDFASASPGGDCPDADPALVAFNGAGEALYYHTDDLGNVLALTDSKGNVLEHYDYDDYGFPSFYNSDGLPLMSNGQLVTASLRGNRYLFHGMMWDATTGLYHDSGGVGVNPLYEDPKSGRYTGRAARTGRNPQTGKDIKVSASSFASDNPWSARTGLWTWTGGQVSKMKTGTVKFFNDAKGFGRMAGGGGGGSGGSFLLKKEEGGRHTPFHNKYRPQFEQRTTDVTGEIDLPEGRAKVILDRDTGRSKGFGASARGIFGKGKEVTGHITLVK